MSVSFHPDGIHSFPQVYSARSLIFSFLFPCPYPQFFRDKLEPGDFFVGIIYMMECSTPFVSLRFILSKLKVSGWLDELRGDR